VKYKEV